MGSAQSFLSFLISFVVFFISLPPGWLVFLSLGFPLTGRKTHGVVPDAAASVRLDPLFDLFRLLHVRTSPCHARGFSLPAALRRVHGEAHRVGPVLLVGLRVLGFFFHRRISLCGFRPWDHRYVCRGFRRGSSQTRSILSPGTMTRGSVYARLFLVFSVLIIMAFVPFRRPHYSLFSFL